MHRPPRATDWLPFSSPPIRMAISHNMTGRKRERKSPRFAHSPHTRQVVAELVLSRITESTQSVLVECHFEHCRSRSTRHTVHTGRNRFHIQTGKMFPQPADYSVKSANRHHTRIVHTCMGCTRMRKLRIRFPRRQIQFRLQEQRTLQTRTGLISRVQGVRMIQNSFLTKWIETTVNKQRTRNTLIWISSFLYTIPRARARVPSRSP